MIDDRAGEFEKYRVPDHELKKMKKGLRRFYEAQNEILDGFAEVDEILDNARTIKVTGELTPLLTVRLLLLFLSSFLRTDRGSRKM